MYYFFVSAQPYKIDIITSILWKGNEKSEMSSHLPRVTQLSEVDFVIWTHLCLGLKFDPPHSSTSSDKSSEVIYLLLLEGLQLAGDIPGAGDTEINIEQKSLFLWN